MPQPGGDTPVDLRRQPGPHVFVADLETLELDDQDRHHFERVLRLRSGDPLTASDGAGAWRGAVFGAVLTANGPIHRPAPRSSRLTLGLALTKASKPEFVVQKATELGIDRIVVFHAAHSVAWWDLAKQAKGTVRLTKVAREAAMQSRQLYIPVVEFVSSLPALVAQCPAVRADFGGGELRSDHTTVLIGPEGGWSSDEETLIPEAVDLGPTVLRAETAAVVAAAFMAKKRYDHPE